MIALDFYQPYMHYLHIKLPESRKVGKLASNDYWPTFARLALKIPCKVFVWPTERMPLFSPPPPSQEFHSHIVL